MHFARLIRFGARTFEPGFLPSFAIPVLPGCVEIRVHEAPRPNNVVRRYREEPPLVRDAAGQWRSGRLDLVLGGEFDLLQAGQR